VRGLARGGPAESSRQINVGDELLYVDNNEVHGRPLSELGQFILGEHARFFARLSLSLSIPRSLLIFHYLSQE
jgi:hypothetical protein